MNQPVLSARAAGARSPLQASLALTLLAGLLLAAVLGSAALGAVRIPATDVLRGFGRMFGLPVSLDARSAGILLSIRIPRVLMAVVAVAFMGIAGATMQGLFRNPLAEPALIGVSSGGALGAVILIVAGAGLRARMPIWSLPLAAFTGSLGVSAVVYTIGRRGRSIATLLLAGIAVNAIAAALTGFFTYFATDAQLRDITFWTLGSLGGATWGALGSSAALAVPAGVVMILSAAQLNALLLGDREAGHLGIAVSRVRRRLVVAGAACVGAVVASTGIIGFIGLVAPHLVRLVLGPDHRVLLPASTLTGALLLVVADTLSRLVLAPAELPVGIVTAFIGAPFFLYLLFRMEVH